MKIDPITPTLGAFISEIDLSQHISEEDLQQVKHALWTYKVITFENQNLDTASFSKFAKQIGEIYTNLQGITHEDERYLGVHTLSRENISGVTVYGGNWHTDHVWSDDKPAYTCLYCIENADVGGDTCFLDTVECFEKLPSILQEYTKQLHVRQGTFRHSLEKAIRSNGKLSYATALFEPRHYTDEEIERIKKGIRKNLQNHFDPDANESNVFSYQKLAIKHPHTNQYAVNISPSYTMNVVENETLESDKLIDILLANFLHNCQEYVLKWKTKQLTIWDNRLVLHKATGSSGKRIMKRCMISDETDISTYK